MLNKIIQRGLHQVTNKSGTFSGLSFWKPIKCLYMVYGQRTIASICRSFRMALSLSISDEVGVLPACQWRRRRHFRTLDSTQGQGRDCAETDHHQVILACGSDSASTIFNSKASKQEINKQTNK